MLKKIFKKLRQDEMLKDGSILFFGTLIGSILNFIFHFYTGRALGPSDYGVFSALLGIAYLAAVFTNTVQTGVANVVARFTGTDASGSIKDLAIRSLKKLILVGFVATIVLAAISPLVASFLHIRTENVLVLSPIVFFLIIMPLNRGLLQGLQRFKALSINVSSEGVFKLLGAFVFITLLGWRVNGATLAFISAAAFPFFLAFFALKPVYSKKVRRIPIDSSEVYKYTLPVFLFLLSATLFFTVDILLVKHFFPSVDAGHYGAASLIGKIVFFAVMPLSQVMFSKVSKIKRNTKDARRLLKKTLVLSVLVGVSGSTLYFLVPRFIINFMFGSDFLDISNILGLFGIVMMLYAIMYALAMFLLAIRKSHFIFGLLFLNIGEIVLIWLFHETLFMVLFQLLITILLMVLFLFYVISKTRWREEA